MPKIKTRRIAAKKFTVNKNGKIKRGHAYHSHNTAKKSAKRNRRLNKMALVDKTDSKAIRKMLPYV